jgi:hypothetical protein
MPWFGYYFACLGLADQKAKPTGPNFVEFDGLLAAPNVNGRGRGARATRNEAASGLLKSWVVVIPTFAGEVHGG